MRSSARGGEDGFFGEFSLHSSSSGRQRGRRVVREKMGREGRVGRDSGGGGQRCWGSAGVRGRFDVALDRSYLDPIHALSGWVGETVERQDVELL